MAAVVDPMLSVTRFQDSILGTSKPQVEIFKTFKEWETNYFKLLPSDKQDMVVIEFALGTDVLFDTTKLYIEAGVKNLILPKPVFDTKAKRNELINLIQKHQVKAAVSSQWHYSSLPKIIARDIERIMSDRSKNEDVELEKAIIDFSKENGKEIAPVTLCELPHSIQILDSIGLLNGTQRVNISGDEHSVYIDYRSPKFARGIQVRAEMDYRRTAEQQGLYPEWDYQERTLSIIAKNSKGETNPILEVDFWMKFSRCGDVVTHYGEYKTYEAGGEILSHGIAEDLLLNMHKIIYEKFDLSYEAFLLDPVCLPIERYNELAFELLSIHEIWQRDVSTKPTLRKAS